MHRIFTAVFLLTVIFIAGCGAGAADTGSREKYDAAAGRRVVIKFSDGQGLLILNDSPAADNLYRMLPLQLDFRDFNRTEKISYPPRPVHEGLRPEGHQPRQGDLCLYAPWGNLCIFYQDYSGSDELFYLGRVDAAGMSLLSAQKDNFTVELSRQE